MTAIVVGIVAVVETSETFVNDCSFIGIVESPFLCCVILQI